MSPLVIAAYSATNESDTADHHFHLDHLGTPRLITDQAGNRVAFHGYYPFGQEATDPEQSPFSLKFTGHERDENGDVPKGVLDYMKARYCSPILGRFLSVDKILGSPTVPQAWNRYTYARGNPLRFIDPDGEKEIEPTKLQILWSRLKHIIANHVRKDVAVEKSKFVSNNPRDVQKLIEKTITQPDRVDRQGDGRLLFQKQFNKEIGTQGETIVRVPTDQVSEKTVKPVTGFPALTFKDLLSFLPGSLGAFFTAQQVAHEAASAAADAVEQQVLESEARKVQDDARDLILTIDRD